MTTTEIQDQLADIREGLIADGYDMSVRTHDAVLTIEIVAGPDSCADCLVPKDLMTQMIRAALGSSAEANGPIELMYPRDPTHHDE